MAEHANDTHPDGGHLRNEDLVGLLRSEMRQDQAYAWLLHCESCAACRERLEEFRATHNLLGGVASADRPELSHDVARRARQAAARALGLGSGRQRRSGTSARLRAIQQKTSPRWEIIAAAAASVLIVAAATIAVAAIVMRPGARRVASRPDGGSDAPLAPLPPSFEGDGAPERTAAARERVVHRRAPGKPASAGEATQTGDVPFRERPELSPEVRELLAAEIAADGLPADDVARVDQESVVPVPAATHLAYVDAADGPVEIRHDGEDEWQPVGAGVPVLAGDRLRTRKARARVVFHSRTSIDINRFTELTFDAEAWPPGIRVSGGEVYVCTAEHDHGFFVATPQGLAVDLGTRFGVDVKPVTGTSVFVIQGVVEASTDIDTVRLKASNEVLLAGRRSAPGPVRTVRDLHARLAWTDAFRGSRRGLPPAMGVAGHWRFDEGRGHEAFDSSGNGLVARLVGARRTVGFVGGALDLDGDRASGIVQPHDALSITGSITLAAWIRIARQKPNMRIVSRDAGRGGGYKLCLDGGRLDFALKHAAPGRGNSGHTTWLSSTPGGRRLSPGRWYHVLGTYSHEGGYLRTYVDGRLDRERKARVVLTPSTGPLIIGRQSFADVWHFCGQIDELTLFNRALSEREITLLARWPARR